MKICKLKGTVWRCFFIALVLFSGNCMADAEQTGTIEGRVVEAESQTPLPGTNVLVLGTPLGAATDADGRFRIARVPVGNWVLRFRLYRVRFAEQTGHHRAAATHHFRAGGVAVGPFSMAKPFAFGLAIFLQMQAKQLSAVRFSAEEVRRAPWLSRPM
jgi:hypothetical protein